MSVLLGLGAVMVYCAVGLVVHPSAECGVSLLMVRLTRAVRCTFFHVTILHAPFTDQSPIRRILLVPHCHSQVLFDLLLKKNYLECRSQRTSDQIDYNSWNNPSLS